MTVEDVIEAVNVTDDAVVEMLANLDDENSDEEDAAAEESSVSPCKIIKQNSQS